MSCKSSDQRTLTPPPDSEHLGGLQRQTTGNSANGHRQCDGGYCRKKNIGGSGDSTGGFGKPTKLDAVVWGSNNGDQVYCWGIWGLDGQWPPTLGSLLGTDVGAPHQPQQVTWCKASQSGRDLASDVRYVSAGGDGGVGQGGMRYVSTIQWNGCGDRRGYSRGASPVEKACPGGGLGVSTH